MSRRSVQAELGGLRQQELTLLAVVVLHRRQTVPDHPAHDEKRGCSHRLSF